MVRFRIKGEIFQHHFTVSDWTPVSLHARGEDEHLLGIIFKGFFEGSPDFVLLADLVLVVFGCSCAKFVQLRNPALQKRAENPRAIGEVQVGSKTDVEKAGNSVLQSRHTVNKHLLLHDKIKEHFPEIV